MVTLLESKLNSLPTEITSKYPELGHAVILEVKPDININQNNINNQNNQNNNQNNNQSNKNDNQNNTQTKLQEEEAPVAIVEEVKEDPVSIFNAFIEENPEYETYYKMVKFKIPLMAVEQKAQREGVDIEMVRVSYIDYRLFLYIY